MVFYTCFLPHSQSLRCWTWIGVYDPGPRWRGGQEAGRCCRNYIYTVFSSWHSQPCGVVYSAQKKRDWLARSQANIIGRGIEVKTHQWLLLFSTTPLRRTNLAISLVRGTKWTIFLKWLTAVRMVMLPSDVGRPERCGTKGNVAQGGAVEASGSLANGLCWLQTRYVLTHTHVFPSRVAHQNWRRKLRVL